MDSGKATHLSCHPLICVSLLIIVHGRTIMYRTWENFGRGKILVNLANGWQFAKFSPPIFINAWVFNKLPTDLPNFSLPNTLESLIHQNFPPPKFSRVQYMLQSSAEL